MEFIAVIALGVALFFGIRMLLQRQGQRLNQRIQEAVTPENARMAAGLLTDEQHRELYRAIAADEGQRALALLKQATGAPVKDCIIAVQALHRFPQKPPSELELEDELGGGPAAESPPSASSPEGTAQDSDEVVDGELVEDVIDGVRDDVGTGQDSDASPVAELDPETGEVVGDATGESPDRGERDSPGRGRRPADERRGGDDEEVDAKARRLMAESGFSVDEELTIPQDWAEQDDEPAGFHLEVQRGDEKITLSHEDLEPWVHDQLYALLRDDHVDEAATLLADHSPLTPEEAHKFLVVFKDQS